MSYFSVELECEGCSHVWEDLIDRKHRGNYFDCPECGRKLAKETLSAPNVMRVGLPDGTKRKGFDEMKKVAALEKQAAGLPHDKRGEIKKEIRKLKKL